MKKQLMAVLLTVCMLLTTMSVPAAAASDNNPFTDVSADSWYYDDVQYVYEEGLMSGTDTTLFAPDVTTTRGMIVTILWRMEGSPVVSGTQFADVNADAYYANAILWASENELVLGNGDNTFSPDKEITRECMALILYRYADYAGYKMTETADLDDYADADKINSYAKEALEMLCGAGLISGMGDNMIAPQGSATRAQIAALLHRFCAMLDSAETKDEYTVTFDYNYSDKGTYKTLTVANGKTVTAPKSPSRTGYTFDGWFTKAEDGKEFDFDTEITKDITLYAQWTKRNTSTISGSVSHDHNYRTYEYVEGTETHKVICSCGDYKTVACTYDTTVLPTQNGTKFVYTCTICGGAYETEELSIYTAAQLTAFAETVNNGNDYTGVTIKLMANIDLTNVAWAPIGTNENHFNGTFDGNGCTISNLTYTGNYAGLFGNCWTESSIENVNLKKVTLTSNHFAGAVVAHTYGDVKNCSVDGLTITCSTEKIDDAYDNGDKVGGIAGWAACGEITDCSVANATMSAYRDIGGILGASIADNVPTNVTGCEVSNVTITVDQTIENNYGYKTPNAAAIIGRDDSGKAVATGNTENNVTINVTVAAVDGKAVVADINGVAYTDIEVAFDALHKGDTITLWPGIHELNKSDEWSHRNIVFNLPDNITIIGMEGAEIQREPVIYATGLTVKNVDFMGDSYVAMQIHGDATFTDCTLSGPNGIYYSTVSGQLTFTNCTINGEVYGVNIGQGSGNVTLTGCTLTGWNSFGNNGTLTITDCHFKTDDVNPDYDVLRFYQDATITDTVFDNTYAMDANALDGDGSHTIEFAGCSVSDGTDLKDIIDWEDEQIISSIIIIDGVTYKCIGGVPTEVTIVDDVIYVGDTLYAVTDDFDSATLTVKEGTTTIGSSALNENSTITEVVLPEGLTTIENRAFRKCTKLTTVKFPSTMTTIGESAFQQCSALTSVVIPEGVTEIGKQAFYACTSVTELVIPEGVTTIGDGAFRELAITEAVIPSTVTYLGGFAFRDCKSLRTVLFLCSTAPAIGENGQVFRVMDGSGDVTVKIAVESVYNALKDDGSFNDPSHHVTSKCFNGLLQDADGNCAVYTVSGLETLVASVNNGTSYNGKTVTLATDLDLSDVEWSPIGNSSSHSFQGTFDGQKHTISGLNVTEPSTTNSNGTAYGSGFFGNLTNGAVIKNVTFSDAKVYTNEGRTNIAGVVAGYAYGTVSFENVAVTGAKVYGYGKVGGILGMAAEPSGTTTLTNCSVKDTTISGTYNCAGLVGLSLNTTTLTDCTVENLTWIGGTGATYVTFDGIKATKGLNGTEVTVSGTYWEYSKDVAYYAAWSDTMNGEYFVDSSNYAYVISDGQAVKGEFDSIAK